MTQAEAIVSAVLAQLAQGKIQNPDDEACLGEFAPPTLGRRLHCCSANGTHSEQR
jgi:hypothetical protein